MLTVGRGLAETCSGVTRRDFLKVGGLGALGVSLADLGAQAVGGDDRAVILLLLVGGPSQLETWDPKPEAPAEVRGPFRWISTAVPGVSISEHLPKLARRMDRLTVVRSLHHDAAPIHETGHQLIQTGRLCRLGQEHPHAGAVAGRLLGSRNDLPPFVVVPGPIGNTGVAVPHGQSAGALGPAFDPFHLASDPAAPHFDARAALDRAQRFLDAAPELPAATATAADRLLSRKARRAFDLASERDETRDAYGRNTFGQSCLLARRLVEAGVRLVTVNMFETVFNRVTWDCHGARPFSTLDDYASELLPTLDAAFSALINDLEGRGLLETTLVLATGEFGRTPRINAAGGRDHWPQVWSAAMAGGGTCGGQVIGASDAHAASPAERPVTPPDLLATIYHSLGIDSAQSVRLADGTTTPLVDGAAPLSEAFA
jgi:uncharacterized protein (DUF1501 family)